IKHHGNQKLSDSLPNNALGDCALHDYVATDYFSEIDLAQQNECGRHHPKLSRPNKQILIARRGNRACKTNQEADVERAYLYRICLGCIICLAAYAAVLRQDEIRQ